MKFNLRSYSHEPVLANTVLSTTFISLPPPGFLRPLRLFLHVLAGRERRGTLGRSNQVICSPAAHSCHISNAHLPLRAERAVLFWPLSHHYTLRLSDFVITGFLLPKELLPAVSTAELVFYMLWLLYAVDFIFCDCLLIFALLFSWS